MGSHRPLPDLVISTSQAFCGNDACRALQFDPSQDPAAQLASPHELPVSLVGERGVFNPQHAAAAAAARPRQVPGSVADLEREGEIRSFLHELGARCLPGQCPACDAD